MKIPRLHGTINHTIIRVSCRVSRRYQNHHHRHRHCHRHHHHHNNHRHHHRHLGFPGRSLRVPANLRVLPWYVWHFTCVYIYLYTHTHSVYVYVYYTYNITTRNSWTPTAFWPPLLGLHLRLCQRLSDCWGYRAAPRGRTWVSQVFIFHYYMFFSLKVAIFGLILFHSFAGKTSLKPRSLKSDISSCTPHFCQQAFFVQL